MKKRMVLFLMAVALITAAVASRPVAAQRLFCHPHIACLIGPVCCSDDMCATFCNNLSPGSVPHCSDPDGGCCSCEPPEG